MAVDDEPPAGKALRPEEWAAVANGLLVLIAPLLIMAVTRLTEEPRAVAVAYVSGPPPGPVAAWLTSVGLAIVPMIPLAAIAAWRTYAHAKRRRLGAGGAWRGVSEAAALGAMPGTVLGLRLVTERGLAALAYGAAYAALGALVGTAIGVVLTATALLVLRVSARPPSVASS